MDKDVDDGIGHGENCSGRTLKKRFVPITLACNAVFPHY